MKKNFLPYTIWKVGGTDYKVRLSSSAILEIERERGSLFGIFTEMQDSSSMPELETMLSVVAKGFSKYHQGTTFDDVLNLYDDYIDEGGDMTAFMTDVFIDLLTSSGLFPREAVTIKELPKK